MGTIPTAPTFVPGETTTLSAKLNLLRDVENFWGNVAQCSAYRTTAQTLTNNTATAIGLDAELFDTPNFLSQGDTPQHDNTTNNTRIVCRTAGKYEMAGQVRFNANATGAREARIRLNGTTDLIKATQTPSAAISTDCTTAVIVRTLAVGDYIELIGFQTSGGNLDIVGAAEVTFLRFKLVAA